MKYLALIRGINVGGSSVIKMAALQEALAGAGFSAVRTYIQSGNVMFESSDADTAAFAKRIAHVIQKNFQIEAEVVVLSQPEWQHIIAHAPAWWGKDKNRKHNLFIVMQPNHMDEIVAAIGTLDPAVEVIAPGRGVLYQSMSAALTGRVTTSKLANSPLSKRLTVRNYKTANALLELY